MEKILHDQLLYDFYGELLTKRQREVMSMYYEEDLGLAEIAQLLKTSRQAVYDNIKRAQKALETYESKLRLVQQSYRNRKSLGHSIDRLENILEGNDLNSATRNGLEEVKAILEGISNQN